MSASNRVVTVSRRSAPAQRTAAAPYSTTTDICAEVVEIIRPQGAPGPAGPVGPAGPMGPAGQQGAIGPAGPAGAGVPSNDAPLMDSISAPGLSDLYARSDHIHPTDTSRAPINNPLFTGNPQAPTPSVGDNDTSIATTAFVKTQGYATTGSLPLPSGSNPLMNSAAAPGAALAYARGDHVHPTDTSLLPLIGGALSGPLLLAADPAAALGAATKQYVDGAVGRAGGPFLPLATGGTVAGATTFNGTTTHGNGSANYWTIAGSSGSPTIQAAGTGNLFATIQGLGTFGTLLRSGNGTNLRTQDSGTTVGNFLLITAAAAGNPVSLTANDNTGGINFGSPVAGNYNFAYSGTSASAANHPFNFMQTISGASTNTAQFPVCQILTTYNGFKTGQGAYSFRVEADVAAGAIMRTNVAMRVAANQTVQPGIAANWAASTAYAAGTMIINGGNLYQATTGGSSAASGGPSGAGGSISDGTVVWQYCDAGNAAQSQVALGVLAVTNFNVGGVTGAPVGNNWGSVIGAGLQSGSTFYNENIGLEVDHFNNAGSSVNRSATVQLVRSGTVQGTYQDWGISFSAASAKWINPILFQSAVDPNGYAISFQDQNAGGVQTMAAVLDMRMVTPTGTGLCGGNFFAAWPNGALGSSGNLNIDYTTLTPGANGLIIDVSLLKCTAASIVSGGTNWVSGMWATDANGNFATVTASGGVVTAAALQIAGYAATAPTGAQSFSALTPSAGLLGPTGSAVRATPFTATLTYAGVSSPTLSLQPSGGTIQAGSGAWTANGTTSVSLTALAPAGAHATVQEWLTIKDASGTVRYVPCF